MLEPKPICAWMSRHAPSQAQRKSLTEYSIVQFPDRWKSAQEAWTTVKQQCGDSLGIVVAVMPEQMLCAFIEMAHPTPVIRPKMAFADTDHWTGKWQRVHIRPSLTYRNWSPE
jgi:hypothetical protein